MAKVCTAARRLEFDMGHRVPNHASKCFNVHGHRYVAIVEVEARTVEEKDHRSEGMVMDFGDIKKYLGSFIDKYMDHGYMGHVSHDKAILGQLRADKMKHIATEFIPTAENIALWLFTVAMEKLERNKEEEQHYFQVQTITLYETPNCFAKVTRANVVEAQQSGANLNAHLFSPEDVEQTSQGEKCNC